MSGIRNQQNQLTEKIEAIKIQRLQTKLQLEQESLRGDQIDLKKSQITTQIKGESLNQEQLKLATAKVTTAITTEDLGRSQDKFAFTKSDRMLDRALMASKLQLKSFDLAEAREQIRHKQVMVGGNSRTFGGGNLPRLGG